MLNSITETKMYNFGNDRYNYTKSLSNVNFTHYMIPEELYIDRINIFKGYKYPFVNKVIDAIKTKKIIPVDFNEPYVKACKTGNLHVDKRFPRSLFSLITFDEFGKPQVLADLSIKGKYQKTKTGEVFYYDIPEVIMYHMFVSAYVQYKFFTNPDLGNNMSLITKVAECYSLIMTKIIDNIVPVAAVSNADFSKLHFLLQTFCMQNMFKLTKEDAIKNAMKSKFVVDKRDVNDSCVYIHTNSDFMECPVNIYPIDNFTNQLYKEYSYINPKNCNNIDIYSKFIERFTNNATFAMDHSFSFINMLLFGKAGIMIYNDKLIKDYLNLLSYDITKELANIIQ